VCFSIPVLVLAAAANASADAATLPLANVTFRIQTPNDDGAWKMIVTNEGDTPVRLAADGRLLTLEIVPPEPDVSSAETKPTAPKPKKPPETVLCRLPPLLRPAGVIDERAVILAPDARYEEVFDPRLYCFGQREAQALANASSVRGKLGFPSPPARGAKPPPPAPPFAVEPVARDASVAPIKELATEPFSVPHHVETSNPTARDEATRAASEIDSRAPDLELSAPLRVEGESELTVAIPFTIKNTGGRATMLHIRRDNMLFDIEGPDGSAHCGSVPFDRQIPNDLFGALRPGAARELDVWVGELCPNTVFDRPGLYQLRPTLVFPSSAPGMPIHTWTTPLRIAEPILVRISRGRLPFYAEPPHVVTGSARAGQ
jgi:hypothetical protein